jgi:hypothetical protein
MLRQALLPLVHLEPKAREPATNQVSEDGSVLVGSLGIERQSVVLAQFDQLIGSRFDEIEEVAVTLLRFATGRAVVGAERGLDVAQKPRVLCNEEVELALREIDEAATHLPMLPAP